VSLLNSYGDLCRQKKVVPKKVVLTFAPCGREKTMTFIKWLGMHVPAEVESRILSSADPVQESVKVLTEVLVTVLAQTGGSGVPLGINVESLSIFREEIDAAHALFQKLQATLLTSYGSPWAVRWFHVDRPLRRHDTFDYTVATKQRGALCDPVLLLFATLLAAGGFVAGRYASK
jgi:sRNA-binding carbon storage regulator CsrA